MNAEESAVHSLSEYKETIGTVGDEVAPTVTLPEYEGGVNAVLALVEEKEKYTGGVNGEESEVHNLPEYNEAIGTVGDEAAPIVTLPEYEGGVNAEESTVHNLSEYKETIGTVGDEPAPIITLPEYRGGVNGEESAVYSLSEYKETIETVGDEVAPVVTLPEYRGGVNAVLALVEEKEEYRGGANTEESAVHNLPEYNEAIGTAGDEPAPTVILPEYEGGVNVEESAVHNLSKYNEANGTAGDEVTPTVTLPEYIGGVNVEESAVHNLPEYNKVIGTVGDEPAPTVTLPEYTDGVNGEESAVHSLSEYKETIGTVGDEVAPIVTLPEYTEASTKPAEKDGQPKVTVLEQTVGNRKISVHFDGAKIPAAKFHAEEVKDEVELAELSNELKAINSKYKLVEVYDLELADSSGNTVDSVGTKRTVTLTNTKGKSIVYYVYRDENNKLKLEKLPTYDNGNGSIVTFDTTHFSKYALVEERSDEESEESETVQPDIREKLNLSQPVITQFETLENESTLNNEWNPFTKIQESTGENVRQVMTSHDNKPTLSIDKAEVKVVKKEESRVLPNTGLQTSSYALLLTITGLAGTAVSRRKNR